MYIYNEESNTWVSIRKTEEYKKRKKIVRDGWFIATAVMLFLPLALQLSIALFATFLSFSFLDEGHYSNIRRH